MAFFVLGVGVTVLMFGIFDVEGKAFRRGYQIGLKQAPTQQQSPITGANASQGEVSE